MPRDFGDVFTSFGKGLAFRVRVWGEDVVVHLLVCALLSLLGLVSARHSESGALSAGLWREGEDVKVA
jgi:hypothetical protein